MGDRVQKWEMVRDCVLRRGAKRINFERSAWGDKKS